MRPLKDGEARFPVESDAVELLRATHRYEPPPGQKQRVTARLLTERASAPRARWLGAPLVVALCLCAAGASAAAGGGWVSRGYALLTESLAPRPAVPPAAKKAVKSRAPHAESASAAPIAPAPSVTPVPHAEASNEPSVSTGALPSTSSLSAVVAERRHVASREVEAAAPSASDAVAKPVQSANEEPAHARKAPLSATEASNLVVTAMRALRQERQPQRAAALLDEYLRRYPSGALAEEALALSVEAATQRGDARAADLAERYLARYPSGRFRRAAERARALYSK